MMEVQNQYFLKRLTLLYPNYITQFYTLQKVTKIVTLVTFCSELKAPFFFFLFVFEEEHHEILLKKLAIIGWK